MAGIIKEFTGISDPSRRRTDAEAVIDTASSHPKRLRRKSSYIRA
jgi:hypothetical protein